MWPREMRDLSRSEIQRSLFEFDWSGFEKVLGVRRLQCVRNELEKSGFEFKNEKGNIKVYEYDNNTKCDSYLTWPHINKLCSESGWASARFFPAPFGYRYAAVRPLDRPATACSASSSSNTSRFSLDVEVFDAKKQVAPIESEIK